MTIRAVVWGENIHERTNEVVASIYPEGMHATIAKALNTDEGAPTPRADTPKPTGVKSMKVTRPITREVRNHRAELVSEFL